MPSARGTSSRTPRPTTPSAIDMIVFERAPSLRTSRRGSPAVHLAAHEHVGQRIDVRRGEPVDVEAEVVARRFVPVDAVRVAGVAGRQHVVVDGLGVLGRRLGGEVAGEADGDAVAHQRRPPRRGAPASGG